VRSVAAVLDMSRPASRIDDTHFHGFVTGSVYKDVSIDIIGCPTAPCNIVADSTVIVTSTFTAGKSLSSCSFASTKHFFHPGLFP
jgi:hypothetical protein